MSLGLVLAQLSISNGFCKIDALDEKIVRKKKGAANELKIDRHHIIVW